MLCSRALCPHIQLHGLTRPAHPRRRQVSMPISATPDQDNTAQARPDIPSLPAAQQDFRSFAELALREIDNSDLQRRMQIDDPESPTSLRRWSNAYLMMSREAIEMGIPASAVPPLSSNPTRLQLLEARDHLNGMILSFQSANI